MEEPNLRSKKQLINLFLNKKTYNLEAELITARKLLIKWPEMEFWKSLSLHHNPPSLSAFLSVTPWVNQEYGGYLLTKPRAAMESKEKRLDSPPGLDHNTGIQSKPRSLRDFLLS